MPGKFYTDQLLYVNFYVFFVLEYYEIDEK